MSNNKQSSSIEWYIIERHNIEIQSRLGKISSTQYDEQLIKIEQQAKAMHHKEVVDFVEDWYCNGPLLGGGVDVAATIEEHYNETFGGNNEQQ
jgi:hypothetical protein